MPAKPAKTSTRKSRSTLTVREGRRIVAAVRRHNRILQTGGQQRSMTANRVGCELIRGGGIGKITKIVACNYPSPWEFALPAAAHSRRVGLERVVRSGRDAGV